MRKAAPGAAPVLVALLLASSALAVQTSLSAASAALIDLERAPLVSPKIVGGQEADDGEYPFYTYVQIGGGFCGGTLIDAEWVLTAAHCLHNKNPDSVRAWVGSNWLEAEPGQPSPIDPLHIFTHEAYDPDTQDNDIALIQLVSPAYVKAASSGVQPRFFTPASALVAGATGVALPMADQVALTAGLALTVIGLGDLASEGELPDRLQELVIPVVGEASCNGPGSYNGALTGHMFCAGEEGKDSCQGDSGGFIGTHASGEWVQVGVVSWGAGCGAPGFPGVYTDVQDYVPWIEAKVAGTVPPAAVVPTFQGTSAFIPFQLKNGDGPLALAAAGSFEVWDDDETEFQPGHALATGTWKANAGGAGSAKVSRNLADPDFDRFYLMRFRVPAQGPLMDSFFDVFFDLNLLKTTLEITNGFLTDGKAIVCAHLQTEPGTPAAGRLVGIWDQAAPSAVSRGKTGADGDVCMQLKAGAPGPHNLVASFVGDAGANLGMSQAEVVIEFLAPAVEMSLQDVQFADGKAIVSVGFFDTANDVPLGRGAFTWTATVDGETTSGKGNIKGFRGTVTLVRSGAGSPRTSDVGQVSVTLVPDEKLFLGAQDIGAFEFSTAPMVPDLVLLDSMIVRGRLQLSALALNSYGNPIRGLPILGLAGQDPDALFAQALAAVGNEGMPATLLLPSFASDDFNVALVVQDDVKRNVAAAGALVLEHRTTAPQPAHIEFGPLRYDLKGAVSVPFHVADDWGGDPVATACTWNLLQFFEAAGAGPCRTDKAGNGVVKVGQRPDGWYVLGVDVPASSANWTSAATEAVVLPIEDFVPTVAFG